MLKRPPSLLGLFVLRCDGAAVLARIDGALYLMAFSDAGRALSARRTLELDGADLYYVCAANKEQLLRELNTAGARGYIVDYDQTRACFARAGAIS
jgi:hypothetical protein